VKVHVGIDLGSTTTKAVVLDASAAVLGRGITNSRSNYDVACEVARTEAFVRARFRLASDAMRREPELAATSDQLLPALERNFRLEQHLEQLRELRQALHRAAETPRLAECKREVDALLDDICEYMETEATMQWSAEAERKSDFFRDLASQHYTGRAEAIGDPRGITFETLCGIFDAAILQVENATLDISFATHIDRSCKRLVRENGWPAAVAEPLRRAIESARSEELELARSVGTGYGRQRLPFAREDIRSEILCHGLGAHTMFPETSTVLDIGGQDTKAIQVDSDGLVTSFQMNDRCAAGCGRYLGYIADEMNLGLHELGPLALQSRRRVKINSTCTVFAGAELRDRLSAGQRREDILGGLHRAIILRAMALLARSGGVHDEFTFTGGVARNPAAVKALRQLVEENYGQRTVNISPDSIYTGALGAALFACRERDADGVEVRGPERGRRAS
jgi:benzoyl-CoA reductase subunit A